MIFAGLFFDAPSNLTAAVDETIASKNSEIASQFTILPYVRYVNTSNAFDYKRTGGTML